MTTTFNNILLWMFVINLGVTFGAGLYEHGLLFRCGSSVSKDEWLVDVEAMRRTDTGRRFWAYVTTTPLTVLTGKHCRYKESRKFSEKVVARGCGHHTSGKD